MLPRIIKLKPRRNNAILKRIKGYWVQALNRDLNILTAVKKKRHFEINAVKRQEWKE